MNPQRICYPSLTAIVCVSPCHQCNMITCCHQCNMRFLLHCKPAVLCFTPHFNPHREGSICFVINTQLTLFLRCPSSLSPSSHFPLLTFPFSSLSPSHHFPPLLTFPFSCIFPFSSLSPSPPSPHFPLLLTFPPPALSPLLHFPLSFMSPLLRLQVVEQEN